MTDMAAMGKQRKDDDAVHMQEADSAGGMANDRGESASSIGRVFAILGAIGDSGSGMRAVINTICLDDRALFTREPAPTDHDGETIEDRLASRAAALIHRWTSERAAVRWWWRYPGSTASSVA